MRKNNITLICLCLVLLLFRLSVKSQEYRTELGFPIKSFNDLSLKGELQVRFLDDGEIYYSESMATIMLDYDLNKRFEIGCSFRLKSERDISEDSESRSFSQEENTRVTADFTYKSKYFDDIRIKNKLRYQASDFEQGINKSYLRNKLLLECKIAKEFTPYSGLEFIYRLEDKEMKSIRFHVGSSVELFKRKFSSYLIIENERKSEEFDLNYILGIKVSI